MAQITNQLIIQQINVTISIQNEIDIFEGAQLILNCIRPQWSKSSIQMKMLSGGITNALVRCRLEDDVDSSDTILIRIYGAKSELFIDRDAEKRNLIKLQEVGISAPLYAIFNNGLAYKYINGTTLTTETVVVPKVYKSVATQMAKLHKSINNNNNNVPMLWIKCSRFLELIPEKYNDPDKQKRFETLCPSKSVITKELALLKSNLEQLNSPIVFTHNDLLLGNIIYNDENNSVSFIDFEYAAYNYQAFDIGNHFAEYIGTDNIDLSNYPSKELQYDWLKEYLTVYNGTKEVSDMDIHNLYVQVNKFALISSVFWGMWSLVQAANSTIDFDFIEYSGIKFGEYFKYKEQFLLLE
ncbi:ethanolamine kinase 1 [Chrysoperla carnea]|uniref:ethanolamine kinase 1 n=1 Tax=Chrysoperla carnea TaxID=189513 RepID=UPI001D07E87B|nr:ethanolamine kinase 1 [Chrysoperla carnea]